MQFVNWYVAEAINSKVIQLNSQKRTKVVVNQMYSKELTIRRNNALKRRDSRRRWKHPNQTCLSSNLKIQKQRYQKQMGNTGSILNKNIVK